MPSASTRRRLVNCKMGRAEAFQKGLWGKHPPAEGEKRQSPAPAFVTNTRIHTVCKGRKSHQNTFGFSQNALIRGCKNWSVYNIEFCRWPGNQLNQLNLNAKRLSAAKAENEQSGETYLYEGRGGNLARIPIHVCVQLTSAVNTEGNATQ